MYVESSEKFEKVTKLDNGLTKTKIIGKVENGWIIQEKIEGTKDGDGEEGVYISETKTWVSMEDPMDTEDLSSGVKDLLDKF